MPFVENKNKQRSIEGLYSYGPERRYRLTLCDFYVTLRAVQFGEVY